MLLKLAPGLLGVVSLRHLAEVAAAGGGERATRGLGANTAL